MPNKRLQKMTIAGWQHTRLELSEQRSPTRPTRPPPGWRVDCGAGVILLTRDCKAIPGPSGFPRRGIIFMLIRFPSQEIPINIIETNSNGLEGHRELNLTSRKIESKKNTYTRPPANSTTAELEFQFGLESERFLTLEKLPLRRPLPKDNTPPTHAISRQPIQPNYTQEFKIAGLESFFEISISQT